MKLFIENNFNIILLMSVVIGLVLPGLEHFPKSTAMILISSAIFFSCSRVSIDELKNVNIKSAIVFYVIRFLLLPIPIYYTALYFVPEYALGVLLIALVPVGASAAAVAVVSRANASLSLSATVITNALAPFVMPALIYMLGGSGMEINVIDLLITLSFAIFLPSFLYFGIVRRVEKLKSFVRRESQLFSILCIGAMMAAVTALEKDYILNNIGQVGYISLIGCILFAALYGIAWIFSLRMNVSDRKTYMICSGVNNTGVGAGLALLYFSPATILFVIVAEVPWALGLMAFKIYADKSK